MTTYAIRSSGRSRHSSGFLLIALESDGEERPIIIFPTEQQAIESLTFLRREEMMRLSNGINSRYRAGNDARRHGTS